MAQPSPVTPVKLLVAVLWSDAGQFDAAVERMQDAWGALDFVGRDHPFDVTDYYDREMGCQPLRRMLAFARLVPPESLRAQKLYANLIEDELSAGGRRRVNLDVGYLDHAKIVLGSLKFAGQKIHLGDGVYADLVARFRGGRYQPLEWSFPDFRDGRYDAELATIRQQYLEQIRAGDPL